MAIKVVREVDGKVTNEFELSHARQQLLRQGLFYAEVRDSITWRKKRYRKLRQGLEKVFLGVK